MEMVSLNTIEQKAVESLNVISLLKNFPHQKNSGNATVHIKAYQDPKSLLLVRTTMMMVQEKLLVTISE